MNEAEARAKLTAFATAHKIVFDDDGQCGFGRPCVGFRHGNNWIDHNPCRTSDYQPIPELACEACWAPEGVDAYHKHDCLAVIRDDEGDDARAKAVIGLAIWLEHMEAKGAVEIVEYETGASGIQAIMSGLFGYAVVVRDKAGSAV